MRPPETVRLSASELEFGSTASNIVIKVKLTEAPQENILPCLEALNRAVLPDHLLKDLPNHPQILASCMADMGIESGLWVLVKTSEIQFTLIYHDKAVTNLLTQEGEKSAHADFEKKKKKLFHLAMMDLILVFNSSRLQKMLTIENMKSGVFKFKSPKDPLVIELRKPLVLEPSFQVRERLINFAGIVAKIKKEIITKIQIPIPMPHFNAAYKNALEHSQALSPEMISSLKTLHTEFEGLILFYLDLITQPTSNYYSSLNALAELRDLIRAINVLKFENNPCKKYYDAAQAKAKEFIDSSPHTITINAEGYPFDEQTWPRDRGQENIEKLHTAQSRSSLFSNTPNPAISFLKEIGTEILDPIIVDVGAGSGRGLFELHQALTAKGLKPRCIAVGVTPLIPEYACKMSAIFYTPIPDSKLLLERVEGAAHFLIDTYGASTYATNPIFALAYYAKLCRPGAKFKGIISGVQQLPDGTPTGFVLTRAKIKAIFDKLNYSFEIHETVIQSQVSGFEHTCMEDFLISFEKPGLEILSLQTEQSFEELCLLLETEVGKPVKYDHKAAFGKFSQFLIAANVYGEDQSQLLTRNLMELGLKSYFIESGFTDGPQIRYAFSFTDEKNAAIFAQKFSERYGFRGNADWLVKIDNALPCYVMLSFSPFDARFEHYVKKWKKQIPYQEIARDELADTIENRTRWENIWLNANAQLAEHFDIPGLESFVTPTAGFIIPSQNPPVRLFVVIQHYDPDEKKVVLNSHSTDDPAWRIFCIKVDPEVKAEPPSSGK